MSKIPHNEKFVIFLNPCYFKSSFFKSFYNKLRDNLENKGITVYNIKTAVKEIKKLTEESKINVIHSNVIHSNVIHSNVIHSNVSNDSKTLLFDDYPYPSTNTLYIHLFNGIYYNDSIYIKKKVQYERDMLFLLAAALGVKSIEYKTDIVETVITRSEAKLSIKGFKNGVTYNKSIEKNEGTSGREEYSNNGSPILIESNTMKDVENKIKNQLGEMSSNIFNIDFYKNNPKLESFVYKRVHYKMDKLEYNIDSEDISDISFSVKSTFMEYGLKISFDKNVIHNEKISFLLIFYTHDELKKENINTKKEENDMFVILKQTFDNCNNEQEKSIAINDIIDYMILVAEKCYYTKDNHKVSFSQKLYYYINSHHDELEIICIKFHSTNQIKNWIYNTLSELYNDVNLYDMSQSCSPRKTEDTSRRSNNTNMSTV
jgi:hypothetical protein